MHRARRVTLVAAVIMVAGWFTVGPASADTINRASTNATSMLVVGVLLSLLIGLLLLRAGNRQVEKVADL